MSSPDDASEDKVNCQSTASQLSLARVNNITHPRLLRVAARLPPFTSVPTISITVLHLAVVSSFLLQLLCCLFAPADRTSMSTAAQP